MVKERLAEESKIFCRNLKGEYISTPEESGRGNNKPRSGLAELVQGTTVGHWL